MLFISFFLSTLLSYFPQLLLDGEDGNGPVARNTDTDRIVCSKKYLNYCSHRRNFQENVGRPSANRNEGNILMKIKRKCKENAWKAISIYSTHPLNKPHKTDSLTSLILPCHCFEKWCSLSRKTFVGMHFYFRKKFTFSII